MDGDLVTESNGRRHVLQELLLMPDAHVIQRAAYALPTASRAISDFFLLQSMPPLAHVVLGLDITPL